MQSTVVQVVLTGSSPPSSDSGMQITTIVWIPHLKVLCFNMSMRHRRESREGTLALNCLNLDLNQVTSAYLPLAISQSNRFTELEGDWEIVLCAWKNRGELNTGKH